MFTKVFNTARRILSRSPSVQDVREEARETPPTSHGTPAEMVTSTRRGPVTPQSSVQKTKGKRSLEAQDTPTATKRRRRSDTQEEETSQENASIAEERLIAESPLKSSDSVGAAVPQENPQERSDNTNGTGGRRRSRRIGNVSPDSKKEGDKVEQTVTTPSSSQDVPLDTPEQSSTKEEILLTPKAKPSSAAGSVIKDGSKKAIPMRQKEKEASMENPPAEPIQSTFPDEIPSSTWEDADATVSSQDSEKEPAPVTDLAPKTSHVRFGSEEPNDNGATALLELSKGTTAEAAREEQFSDEEEDSDEAPEEITAATAISKTRAVEAEAAKAFKAQQERERQRKKERADRIAEEQAEKRKRLEKRASEFARVEAKKQARRAESGLDIDMRNLPALLPDSLLEAAGDVRPPTPPPTKPGKSAEEKRKEKLNRHIKFLEQSQKPVKDVRKGSVNVRVLGEQNEALAPKVNKGTKNIREKWLKGREVEKKSKQGKRKADVRKMQRRPFGGGFLRDED